MYFFVTCVMKFVPFPLNLFYFWNMFYYTNFSIIMLRKRVFCYYGHTHIVQTVYDDCYEDDK